MKSVEVRNLAKGYGGIPVLRGLDFTVFPGERVAILGPSGSGKSTLLRLVAGFEAPDEGEILLEEKTVSAPGRILVPPWERGVGMVFQDLALWPHLTAAEHLDFVLEARGLPREERKKAIREMLSLMDLSGKEDRRPGELSGGERQRLALARALVTRPRVLLLDEPLSSLDPLLNRRLRREILRLHRLFGFPLLLVTHRPEEARDLGERALILHRGRFVAEISPSKVSEETLEKLVKEK